jgi:hypothetical protein
VPEREAILRALDDPSTGLAELGGVLLKEREWRVREGLVSLDSHATSFRVPSRRVRIHLAHTGEGQESPGMS